MAALLATRLMERREWLEMHPDARAVRLASVQRGATSGEQLRIVGFSRAAVGHRIKVGRLHRLHLGVFAVGRPDLDALGAETAALLACGPGTVLSHRSAAALWGFAEPPAGVVDVATSGNAGRGRDGIVNHRTSLSPSEIRTKDHLRVTSPARTLLSLAGAADEPELERMVGEAARRNLTTSAELVQTVGAHPGHRGAARLRRVLEGGPTFTRSEAERRMLALIRAARLPAPDVNSRVAGHEVDFAWPDRRLVLEVDGYAFHASRSAVEKDRDREVDLDAAGFEVLRCTWRQITAEPEALLVRLARRL